LTTEKKEREKMLCRLTILFFLFFQTFQKVRG
jgi:hypothetical protein